MPRPDEPVTSAPRPRTTAARRKARPPARAAAAAPAAAKPPAAELLALTIDAANGRVVTVERVEKGGARRALTDDDRTRLSSAHAGGSLRQLIVQAFEAGIETVLGEGDEDAPEESSADGELSRLLLRSLIDRSKAKKLIERESVDRAMVATLIGRAAMIGSGASH